MKKTGGKWLCMMLFISLLCGCVTGCGSKASEDDFRYESEQAEEGYGIQENGALATEESVDSYEEAKELSDEDTAETIASGSQSAVTKNKAKIIKRYFFHYETETFDDSYSYLKGQIKQYGGYVSSSEMEGTEFRTLELTARIPADVSDEFTSQLGSLGTVVSQSESAEDVTLQYTDTESRIASLKIEQERLNALLEKADSLENIFALEERLTDVRYELENYQSQKKHYDDLISYSTVNITLKEVSYTVEIDDSSVFSRISTGFKSSLRDVKNDLEEFFIWLIVMIPYLIKWAVVLLIIGTIVRIVIRFRKKRNLRASGGQEIIGEEIPESHKE